MTRFVVLCLCFLSLGGDTWLTGCSEIGEEGGGGGDLHAARVAGGRGGRAAGSRDNGEVPCKQRKKCRARNNRPLHFYDQNCMCDDACKLYGDCCRDYDGDSAAVAAAAAPRFKLSRKTLSCVRVIEIDPLVELYQVDTCPRDFADAFIKEKCENVVAPETFLEIPVSGLLTGLLYRNYYCALCAGDTNITFWSIRWKCDKEPALSGAETPDTEGVLEDVWLPGSGGCSIEYSPPDPSVDYRKCKSNLSRCPRGYRDTQVADQCKGPTSYVYVTDSNQIFRNEFCAQCYGVNATYLACEDPRRRDMEGLLANSQTDSPSPFALIIDLNAGKGEEVAHRVTATGERHESRHVIDLQECTFGQVYDPFSGECRQIFCATGSRFVGGACVRDDDDDGSLDPESDSASDRRDANPDDADSDAEIKIDDVMQTSPEPTPDRDVIIEPIPGMDGDDSGMKDVKVEVGDVDPGNPEPEEEHPEDEYDPDVEDSLEGPFVDGTPTGNGGVPRDCPLVSYAPGEYEFLTNNSVFVHGSRQVFNPDMYFFSHGQLYVCSPHKRPYNENVTGNDTEQILIFSFSRMQSLISFVGVLISLVSLLICFTVYLMLPPLRNVPGNCVISLTVALFVGQALFLVGTTRREPASMCFALAVVTHYCFLAAYCWVNCLAINICLTAAKGQPNSDHNPKRFTAFSLYAWVLPAVVVGGSVSLDLVAEIPVSDAYRPHYGGDAVCWITHRYPLMFYFAAPLALLFLVNLALFICTTRRIYAVKPLNKAAAARRQKDKNRLLVYVKLSLLLALTWVFALLAVFLDLNVLWYIFIALNTLQGAVICFAFVCTRKVFRLLRGLGRVHRTGGGYPGRAGYSNGGPSKHSGDTAPWGYARTSNVYSPGADGEARVISQETSI